MRSAHASPFNTRRSNSGKAKVLVDFHCCPPISLERSIPYAASQAIYPSYFYSPKMFIFEIPPASAPFQWCAFFFFLVVILLLLLGSYACTLVLEDAGEAETEIFGNIKTCLVSDDRLAEWWGGDSRNDTT